MHTVLDRMDGQSKQVSIFIFFKLIYSFFIIIKDDSCNELDDERNE